MASRRARRARAIALAGACVLATVAGCLGPDRPRYGNAIGIDLNPGTRVPTETPYPQKMAIMGQCETARVGMRLPDVGVKLVSQNGEITKISDGDGRFGFVIAEAQEFTFYITPPAGWIWLGMTYDRFWEEWTLIFERGETETVGVRGIARRDWQAYAPEVYNEHLNAPMPPTRPPLTPTPTRDQEIRPTHTPTLSPTPKPTPTMTRLPQPSPPPVPTEVSEGIPYDVRLNLIEASRTNRDVESWVDVFNDPLVIVAGNHSYDAQIGRIMTYVDESGEEWRMMETCRGMWYETPTGEIWFHTGFWGPIVKEWPRDYSGKE